jgi:hypothetical protein
VNQRWRLGRDTYRPAGEIIDPSRYEVSAIPQAVAEAFVERHHYSRSYPPDRFNFGLWRGQTLAGVAVFSVSMNDRALTNVFPGEAAESAELGRFVLLDDVPGNGETWFLARCFRELRRDGLNGIISFSDPVPRTDVSGATVFPGHIGTIYQAHNARYIGRGTARTLRLLPDGTLFSERTLQKVRKQERGWEAAVELLARHGAPPFAGEPRAWLRAALAAVTRTLRHPGNHKYAWPLQPRVERFMPTALPYPKKVGA